MYLAEIYYAILINSRTSRKPNLPYILTVELNDYEFELMPGHSNKIEQFNISKQVREDRVDLLKSTIESGQGGFKSNDKYWGDRETHKYLIDKFQMI